MKKYIIMCGILVLIIPHLIKAQEVDSLKFAIGEETLQMSSNYSEADLLTAQNSIDFYTNRSDVNHLVKSIDATSDKYTGIVNIDIPLYELETNSGKLPVTLRYQTTGIRLEDKQSVVGLGWQLSAGGSITRVRHGKPDNRTELEYADIHAANWNIKDWNNILIHNIDTQPDVYYYEFPGGTGSFVFDTKGIAHTIPFQNLLIDNQNDDFILIDSNGTKYYFGYMESSHERNNDSSWDISYKSKWNLEKIVYLNGATVSYEYKLGQNYSTKTCNYLTSFRNESYPDFSEAIPFSNGPYYSRDLSITTEIMHPRYLSKIRYKDQEIVFSYAGKNSSLPPYKRLEKFDVYSNNVKCRTFEFIQDTFPDRTIKLLSIREHPTSSIIRDICSFKYYQDVYLPEREDGYYGFDHWGYCNTDIHKPLKYPDNILIDSNVTIRFGASRKPDLAFTRSQTLKKIIYPNGGSKEFVYELHNGRNLKTNTQEDAGGLRIKEIIERENNDATPSITRYEYSGGVIYDDTFNYIKEFCLNFDMTYIPFLYISSKSTGSTVDMLGSSVVYSSVQEYLPNGSLIRYHYVPYEQFPDTEAEKTELEKYSEMKEINGRAPKTQRSWGRYILQDREWVAQNGISIRKESYQYLIDTAHAVKISSRVLYGDRRYIKAYSPEAKDVWGYICIAKYQHISCPVLMNRTEVKGKGILPEKTFYYYNEKSLPYLTIQKDCEGNYYTILQKYTFDYKTPLLTDGPLKKMIDNHALLPIEKINYKNGKILNASLNLYRMNENNAEAVVPFENLQLKYQQALDSASFESSYIKDGIINYDRNYCVVRTYDDYNKDGDLLCYHDKNGIYNSEVINNTTFPCAYVENARFSQRWGIRTNQVYFDDFEINGKEYSKAKSGLRVGSSVYCNLLLSWFTPGKYILSYWYKIDDVAKWKKHEEEIVVTKNTNEYHVSIPKSAIYIDDVCLIPQNAIIKSQVVQSGVGKLSETDEHGFSTYYEYNDLGLPSKIYDNERNLITKYSYDNYGK